RLWRSERDGRRHCQLAHGLAARARGIALSERATRATALVILALVGGLLLLNLLAQGLDQAVGGSRPSGVPGSSYATTESGLNAYASLLTHFGFGVIRARGAISKHTFDAAQTMVVLEPEGMSGDDTAALADFVQRGGRLVIGGSQPYYLRGLSSDAPPHWVPDGETRYAEISPDLNDIHSVAAAGTGAWSELGVATSLVHSGNKTLLARQRVGAGEILYLADVSPIENARLGSDDDNAALGLALAGSPNTTVEFAEGVHGYTTSRGWRAIPTRWKYALLGLAVAGLLLITARAWRFGAPDRPNRKLAPARAEYVRALAMSLERTRAPESAFEPMRRYARARVVARTALPPDAGDELVDRNADALGCTVAERAALFRPVHGEADALALGALVARVGSDRRST
ncbi:MAG TPA: DUF4350 domain-containing protein, partial [Acidimicrobiia bacterium]|nr:DUF4350 domain-containing protein [Acidimicrobiia bacterium]